MPKRFDQPSLLDAGALLVGLLGCGLMWLGSRLMQKGDDALSDDFWTEADVDLFVPEEWGA